MMNILLSRKQASLIIPLLDQPEVKDGGGSSEHTGFRILYFKNGWQASRTISQGIPRASTSR